MASNAGSEGDLPSSIKTVLASTVSARALANASFVDVPLDAAAQPQHVLCDKENVIDQAMIEDLCNFAKVSWQSDLVVHEEELVDRVLV